MFFVALLSGTAALAFESNEHRWLSDRGRCVALDSLRRDSPERNPARLEEAIRVLELIAGEGNLASYANLSAYADFTNFEDDYFSSDRGAGDAEIGANLRDRQTNFFSVLTELIRNPHHFRGAALKRFHHQHERAVLIASTGSSGSLRKALAINAYADHFLEDFFAPGHMTEDGEHMGHMERLRVHDRDNDGGREFELNHEAVEGLVKLAGPGDETLLACGSPSNSRDLQAPTVELFGDGHLDRVRHAADSEEAKKVAAQETLIVLAIARSIRDVVDAYIGESPTPPNHYSDQECSDADDASRSCYFVDRRSERQKDARIALGSYVHRTAGSFQEPVVGFSAEVERLNEGSRKNIHLEGIWTSRHPPPKFLGDAAVEVSAGYGYLRGNDYQGHGPEAHAYLRWKELPLFAGVDVAYPYYTGQGVRAARPTGGVTVGLGTGPLWLYIRFGSGHSIEDGELKTDPLSFRLGAEVMAARSSVLHSLRMLFSK